MPVVNGQFVASSRTVDDVYVSIIAPQNNSAAPGATFIGGTVGVAAWGPFNHPIIGTKYSDLVSNWGPSLNTGYDIVRECGHFLNQKPLGGVAAVRVGDGSQTYATSLGAPTVQSDDVVHDLYLFATGSITAGQTVTVVTALPSPSSGAPGDSIIVTAPSGNLSDLYTAMATAINADSGASGYMTASSIGTALHVTGFVTGAAITEVTASVLKWTANQVNAEGALIGTYGPATSLSIPQPVATSSASNNVAVTWQGFYQGTLGNTITVTYLAGSRSSSASPSYKVVVQISGGTTEIYDNIPQGSTPTATWTAIVNAINNGLNTARPASQIVTGVVAAPTAQPVVGFSTPLSGGTDGVNFIHSSTLVGMDGTAGNRTGMYAYEGLNLIDSFWICGLTDVNVFPAIDAFVSSEFMVAFCSLPLDTTSLAAQNYVAARNAVSTDDYEFCFTAGQHVIYDQTLQQNVAIYEPAGWAGLACSLPTNQPIGNRPFLGLVGTDITVSGRQPFGTDDLGALEAAGVLVTAQIPADAVLGSRFGKNSSTNTAINEVAYSRQTNEIARALNGPQLGQFIDRNQTIRPNDPTRASICTVIDDYFGPRKAAGIIDDYSRVCDLTNNPIPQIQAYKCQVDIEVEYLSVINIFLVNILAGQTVTVSVSSTAT